MALIAACVVGIIISPQCSVEVKNEKDALQEIKELKSEIKDLKVEIGSLEAKLNSLDIPDDAENGID